MELKRYVQINRGDVYDLQDERQRKAYEIVKNGTHSVFGIKRLSYTILDLVEGNDLLELNSEEIVHVFGIDEENGDYILVNKDMIIKNSFSITAIYKRQPNGDYKRYEVKA